MKKILLLAAVALAILLAWTRVNDEVPNQVNAPPQAQPSFDKGKLPTDKPDSLWVVINKTRPLQPLQFEPEDLVEIENGQTLRKEAAEALERLKSEAKKEDHEIEVISGFRSFDTQKTVYSREVAAYGQLQAETQSARPGYSEHQTGLAVDVGSEGCNLDDCFGNTKEGKWVAKNAHVYGFIVRYVSGKEDITGYKPEPWHLRYIGTELAVEMHTQNIQTLEEFFEL